MTVNQCGGSSPGRNFVTMLTHSNEQQQRFTVFCRAPKDSCQQVGNMHSISQGFVRISPHPDVWNDEHRLASVSSGVYIPTAARKRLTQYPYPAGWRTCKTGAGEVYYTNDISKTTTWTRPVTVQASPSPPPSYLQHVAKRERKSTRNCLRIVGTAGMIGTLLVLLVHDILFFG